ncbi:MAG: SIS domain-containing protein [Clostridia bacterium]|nr:SIS domain-containing protein [Clostridia bacterium]
MKDETLRLAMNAFSIESESLLETAKVLDPAQFSAAVVALVKAPRIAATGCGHSGIAARHFAHLMCCVERPARFLSPAEAPHGALGFLQKGDVLVWASRGGKTDELTKILEIAKGKGATIIGVTEALDSPLAKQSDILLAMKVTKETDRFNCQGTTSFAVTNAIFDALQTAVMEECGFVNEEFAVIHPNGAVGKRLNKTENK